MRWPILIVGLAASGPAAVAQTTDWCATPLALQADPGSALVWRLRCTIQILDRERTEAADHATTAEIDKAVSEARLRSVQEELDGFKKKADEAAKAAQTEAAKPPEVLKPLKEPK